MKKYRVTLDIDAEVENTRDLQRRFNSFISTQEWIGQESSAIEAREIK